MAGREQWHLDKRVPVAIIAALAMQAAGAIWWGSGIETTQRGHAERLAALEEVDDRREREMRQVDSRLARIEANNAAQLNALQRIERILDGNLFRLLPDDRGGSGE